MLEAPTEGKLLLLTAVHAQSMNERESSGLMRGVRMTVPTAIRRSLLDIVKKGRVEKKREEVGMTV